MTSIVGLCCTSASIAQTPPSYGLDFVTVGAPGNRGTHPDERPLAWDSNTPRGGVAQEFRITRTEVLTSQWLEFVQAYAPFNPGAPNSSAFTGDHIFRRSDGNGYGYPQERANYAINPSFAYMARYCNWLQNGKVNQAWAFETGAYDTSTFTPLPDGTRRDQPTRSPGAQFWVPNFDEYVKSFYYDPNRYGSGQGGYWQYTNMSDSVPIPGVNTSAGTFEFYVQTGLFPNAVSPWGLLDTSGSVLELSETLIGPTNGLRQYIGSVSWDDDLQWQDWIGNPVVGYGLGNAGIGFRVASAVPEPSTVVALVVGFMGTRSKRKQR